MEDHKASKIDDVAQLIDNILEKMKYGSITLVVQDGKIIQVESHEKIRIK